MDNDDFDDYDDVSASRNLYSIYSKEVQAIPRTSKAEQAADQSAKVFQSHFRDGLWQQATKIVLYVLSKMKQAGRLPSVSYQDMDAIQEANLAVGLALRKWEPERGTLSTYLTPIIRGALLNYANTHRNMGIGSKHVTVTQVGMDEYVDSEEDAAAQDMPGVEQGAGITREEALQYEHEVIPDVIRTVERAQLREAISKLGAEYQGVLFLHYVDGYTVEQIAEQLEEHRETVRRRLRAAERGLRHALS